MTHDDTTLSCLTRLLSFIIWLEENASESVTASGRPSGTATARIVIAWTNHKTRSSHHITIQSNDGTGVEWWWFGLLLSRTRWTTQIHATRRDAQHNGNGMEWSRTQRNATPSNAIECDGVQCDRMQSNATHATRDGTQKAKKEGGPRRRAGPLPGPCSG